ncbi:MAG: ankyrin repeat domain-containing protein [Planctomycetales bacterium]
MAVDEDDIKVEIAESLDENDLATFERLLCEHPRLLRYDDGRNRWLWHAAAEGLLPFVQILVEEFGVGVDEPTSKDDPEGAIADAAREGHVEVVRWFLDHGAKINHVVDGEHRCSALRSAVTNGHFEIVKLLVEHGANIHAASHGLNALSDAEMYGYPEIAEYLRSHGAKHPLETATPDYAAAHAEFRRIMAEQRGELADWLVEVPGEPAVVIHAMRPNMDDGSRTLFTVGMSDVRVPLADDPFFCSELILMLPPDWPLTAEALADPQWNWPVEWLKRLAREALDPGEKFVRAFPNGDPPQPFAENTQLCAWLCVLAQGAVYQMPDYRWVARRSLFAIHDEERLLVETAGDQELLKRFEAANVATCVEVNRPSV